jgi:hypothetical protein
VAAAAEDDEAAFGRAQHHRLVVQDQRVGLPAALPECLASTEASLELRGAIDLARDQHRAVEQDGGPALLDDPEPGAL